MVKKAHKKKIKVNLDNAENGQSDKSEDERETIENALTCKFCESTFLNGKKTSEHEENCESRKTASVFITFDGKIKFVCTVCNQLFKFQTGLKKHELRHKPPGGFICSECGECFLTDAERLLHKENVHKMFKCLICDEKFTADGIFLKHIDEQHGGRDREYLVCDDCGAQFRQKNQLRLHNESKCGTVRCYSCEQCNFKFMTQNTLNAHLLIHVGEKKHLCDFCGTSFLSRGQLKIHERSHTKEKPYKCDVCDKAFSHRESLVTHSSIHTGIKPYICECCGNQFSCIGNLIKHRRTRPHTCGLPQYQKNVKCAPRASGKVAGSFTIKKDRKGKRSYAKRKEISVPELLSVRVEMTNAETESIKVESGKAYLSESCEIENEFSDLLIIGKKTEETKENRSPSEFEDNLDVMVKTDLSNCSSAANVIQLSNQLGQEVYADVNNEITLNQQSIYEGDAIAYSLASNIVFVTSDGNYMITSYEEHASENDDENNFPVTVATTPAPQPEEIIVLNSEVQYANNDSGQNNTELSVDMANVNENISTEVICTRSKRKLRNSIATTKVKNNINENVQQCRETNADELETTSADQENNLLKVLKAQKRKSNESQTIGLFQCEMCSSQFKYKKSFFKHMELDHEHDQHKAMNTKYSKKQFFDCEYCDKKYRTEKLLAKHMPCHGENGKLIHKCPCCRLHFETKEKAQAHSYKEHEDRLRCSYCKKFYKDLECIAAHVRKLHTKTGAPQKKYTFVCIKCGKKFTSRVALSDHEQADCGRSPIYKCSDCGKCLHSAGSLKTHQLIHTGDLPHVCNFCGKAFRTQGQVKVHERSHNGEKPFKCEKCPKAFAHRESLLTHISLHTGIKRFMCQGCGCRFSCISNLQAHRKTHHNTCGQLPIDTKAQWTYSVDGSSVCLTTAMSDGELEVVDDP